jgi:RNA polymerase sigma factor FliA
MSSFDPQKSLDKKALAATNWFRVRAIAGKRAKKLPFFIKLDDLVSYGALGLMDAVEKFDPSLGFKFTTYANWRIHGAISDGVRETQNKLKQAMHRDEVSIEDEEYELAADERLSPESEVLREDIACIVRKAVEALPASEKEVIRLVYFEGLTHAEAAMKLGFSIEWIYQLRRRAKASLRCALADCI